MLSPTELRQKRKLSLALVGYFFLGYYFLNFFNLHRSYYLDLSFAFEREIPFVPEALLGYILVFGVLLLFYFLLDNIQRVKESVTVLFIVTTFHFLCFAVFPVKMAFRPEIVDPQGLSLHLVRFYFLIDQPTNLFPSLHVAYPTAVTCLLWRYRSPWRFAVLIMTITVAVSVILVKQHYIVDVVAGAVTSYLLVWIVLRMFKRCYVPIRTTFLNLEQ